MYVGNVNRKDIIFDRFKEMFPNMASAVKSYERAGSKAICLTMKNEKKLFFLYNDPDNWNFGTKQWRKRPDPNFIGGSK